VVVLIVTKTTNYELHGALIESKVNHGLVARDSLTRLQKAHSEHYETLGRLRLALAAAGLKWAEVSRDFPRPWSKSYDLVITVGGDGTLLAASHQLAQGGLIAGVRSSSLSVGYLCTAGTSEVEDLVKAIATDRLRSSVVHRLKARVRRVDVGDEIETTPVLNDFLYANSNPAATTRYRLNFDGKEEVHRSSGIWVATATGSTAASLAAGGERRPPEDALYQFRVRELYKFDLGAPAIEGGLFDPTQNVLEIENRCPAAILATDGQHGVIDLVYGDRVSFVAAAPINLVRGWRD
jgi:NAD+ kinase